MSDFQELAANLRRMGEENTDRKFSQDDMDDYWCDLSEREREKAFYCVVNMLNEARELDMGMRETLYEMFEFKPSMYNIAVDAGFRDLQSAYEAKEDEMQHVNRVEVIDNIGRAYVNMSVGSCNIELQDTGQTLKVFVSTDEKTE